MTHSLIDLARGGAQLGSVRRTSTAIERQIDQEVEYTVGRVQIAETKEIGRGIIANTALHTVGALSALESHLIQIAPLGSPRYRQIVDAYTLGAAQTIARFQ